MSIASAITLPSGERSARTTSVSWPRGPAAEDALLRSRKRPSPLPRNQHSSFSSLRGQRLSGPVDSYCWWTRRIRFDRRARSRSMWAPTFSISGHMSSSSASLIWLSASAIAFFAINSPKAASE